MDISRPGEMAEVATLEKDYEEVGAGTADDEEDEEY